MTTRLADSANPLLDAFKAQRQSARRRNIPFLLTFEEWLSIWQESGKLEKRGCRSGCYVMARRGDVGPYSRENVIIITHKANMQQRTTSGRRPSVPISIVKALRREYKKGVVGRGVIALGKKYGVSSVHVWNIVNGNFRKTR